MSDLAPCRTYILYRHALFAHGVRSLLEQEHSVQIVGMESDMAQAVKAVSSLHPEVILVEESADPGETWPFFELAAAGRIVTFSIDHGYATVYNHHRSLATEPADLVQAIRGARAWETPQDSRADPQGGMASTAERPVSGTEPGPDGSDLSSPGAAFKRKARKPQHPSRKVGMPTGDSVGHAKE
jgi:DNA-binding NarL/FixJ family response regulator